jgi:hypothetical protein
LNEQPVAGGGGDLVALAEFLEGVDGVLQGLSVLRKYKGGRRNGSEASRLG